MLLPSPTQPALAASLISNAERLCWAQWAELREGAGGGGEKERGRGCCGSHFIEQPGSGQGCRIMLQQPNGCCSKNPRDRLTTLLTSRLQTRIPACWQSILNVHRFIPLFHPSPFIAPSWFEISDALACCAAHSKAECVSVYSPARSRSLSLIEAPVIVGRLLL